MHAVEEKKDAHVGAAVGARHLGAAAPSGIHEPTRRTSRCLRETMQAAARRTQAAARRPGDAPSPRGSLRGAAHQVPMPTPLHEPSCTRQPVLPVVRTERRELPLRLHEMRLRLVRGGPSKPRRYAHVGAHIAAGAHAAPCGVHEARYGDRCSDVQPS